MRPIVSRSLLVAIAFGLGVAHAQVAAPLTATLALAQRDYAKDADVEVTVTLTNATNHAVDVPAQSLATAGLLLDVRDAAGRHMPTVSPPAPRADVAHFAPGERRIVKVRLDVFSPSLPRGDYVVMPAPSLATGAAVPFHVR